MLWTRWVLVSSLRLKWRKELHANSQDDESTQYFGHRVRLDNRSAMSSGHVLVRRRDTFDRDRLLFTSFCVIGEKGQETVTHAYRRNVKEHVVGFVRPGEKIQKDSYVLVRVSWGVPGATSLSYDYVPLQGPVGVSDQINTPGSSQISPRRVFQPLRFVLGLK